MQRLDKIVINRLQRRDQSQLAGKTFLQILQVLQVDIANIGEVLSR